MALPLSELLSVAVRDLVMARTPRKRVQKLLVLLAMRGRAVAEALDDSLLLMCRRSAC